MTFAELIGLIETDMADSTISHHAMRIEQSRANSPRRVVWIPTEFENIPIKSTNHIVDDVTGDAYEFLALDQLTVEAHIVGETFDDVCAIRGLVIMAVRRVFSTASQLAGGAYETQLEHNAANMYGGREKVLQRFRWEMQVLKNRKTTVVVQVVETVEQTLTPA